MRRTLVWLLLVPALAAGCGGQGSHAAPADRGARAGLISIGHGRSLFLDCAGSGGPTVILDAGFGAGAAAWGAVQPQLARTTRTCSYDRAGVGESVGRPGVHDAGDEIEDLERLLAGAHVDPPYVLVGHSYGGVLARVFAQRHPTETAGVVLIDTMGRDGRRRQLAIWPESEAPEKRRLLAASVIGDVDLGAGEALADGLQTLGATPLAVVTAGREDSFPRSPTQLAAAMRRLWNRMQDELAALSSNSIHVVALRSNHDVPSPRTGEPAIVVRATRAVVRAARDHAPLPPCRSLFRSCRT